LLLMRQVRHHCNRFHPSRNETWICRWSSEDDFDDDAVIDATKVLLLLLSLFIFFVKYSVEYGYLNVFLCVMMVVLFLFGGFGFSRSSTRPRLGFHKIFIRAKCEKNFVQLFQFRNGL
jgi:hypothetical protein